MQTGKIDELPALLNLVRYVLSFNYLMPYHIFVLIYLKLKSNFERVFYLHSISTQLNFGVFKNLPFYRSHRALPNIHE